MAGQTRTGWWKARALAVVAALAMGSAAFLPTASAATSSVVADPGTAPWSLVPREQVAQECGLDPDLLDAANAAVGSGTSFTVVRFGKLCYRSAGPSTTAAYSVWSVTKTFGALLVGYAATRSSLSDTDLASKWLTPAQMNASPALNPNATVAHMLATIATSSNLAVDQKSTWVYDTLGSNQLNRLRNVINAVIAAEPHNFPGVNNVFQLAAEFFGKMGMATSQWPSTPGGFLGLIGGTGDLFGYGLRASVDDMARMGQLMLRKGVWNGERLIDEEYIYRMTHPAFADANPAYGYATWLNTAADGGANVCAPFSTWPYYPHEPFFETTHDYGGSPFDSQPYDIGVAYASGLGGQHTIVHRGLDLVISTRSASSSNQVWNAIRPALVALDPVFAGDEEGFCDAYRRSAHAPNLISGWAPRTKDGCKDEGWRYGPYRNQGECVSAFERVVPPPLVGGRPAQPRP